MANGVSDIKLLDEFDGQVMVDAPDLCVDGGPARRQGSNTKHRRALVHAFGDGLTINFENDYRGGVTINGVKTITGHSTGQPPFPFPGITIDAGTFLNVNASALTFKGTTINLDSQPAQPGGVKITGDAHFDKGGVTIDGRLKINGTPSRGVLQGPKPTIFDVADEISSLKAKVAALEKKLFQ